MSGARAGVVIAALWSLGGSCGTKCPTVEDPGPMTEDRAALLDPAVGTGIAFSTTLIYGDCRAKPAPEVPGPCGEVDPACSRSRSALRVLVVPAMRSVPKDPSCDGAYAVADVAAIATLDLRASPQGEVVAPLPEGGFAVLLSDDDACADCGPLGAGTPCVVDVRPGRVSTRDLVLDRSTR